MARPRWLRTGGSAGNGQLTGIVATVLLVLFAIEGATLIHIQSLLTTHVFVGILLVPIVVLKVGSISWRMARYYLGDADYVQEGPPHPALRFLIAPVILSSTVLLLGSGIALLATDTTSGVLVGLHKASFVVWLGSTGIHVLAHVLKLPRLIASHVPGAALRVSAAAGVVLVGLTLAVATLPAADHLQDKASGQIGLDER
jgi:hypothetical protein